MDCREGPELGCGHGEGHAKNPNVSDTGMIKTSLGLHVHFDIVCLNLS